MSRSRTRATITTTPFKDKMQKSMNQSLSAEILSESHWAQKDGVRLSLWRKKLPDNSRGTILFVHGSSMSGRPTFDLHVEGRPEMSAMNWFAQQGFDTWCVDMEGYGLSDKHRPINCDIANGADDLIAAATYIRTQVPGEKLLVYGISSGALRAAMFAERRPDLVARVALDAFVWTGADSPTLEQRRKKLPAYKEALRRPIDRAFVHSIFTRDHPGTADDVVVNAFADAILSYDDSIPNGTYVDMCENLPLVDPHKVEVPTLIMRGEYDGIADISDLLDFFSQLSNPDKAFAVMPGIAHASFQQKNFLLAFHILLGFFTQPAPVYKVVS